MTCEKSSCHQTLCERLSGAYRSRFSLGACPSIRFVSEGMSLSSMARRVSDLNWGIQGAKRNADSGGNDAAAARMGYSDRLLVTGM